MSAAPGRDARFSTLWLDARLADFPQPNAKRDDLRLGVVAAAIAPYREYQRPIHTLLATPLTDIDTLRYRQDALDDCLATPEFSAGLADLLPTIRALGDSVHDIRARRNEVSLVLSRLAELENYVDCVIALHDLLQRHQASLKSRAWMGLTAEMQRAVDDPVFQSMRQELPDLRERVQAIVSVTIGVNLSPDLRPVGATVLSVNQTRFKGPHFLRALFGIHDPNERRGLTQLRQRHAGHDPVVGKRGSLDRLENGPLFSDLRRLLDDIIRPVNLALGAYTGVNSRLLRAIAPEIAFYIGAARLISDMRADGLPMCRPTLLPPDERCLRVKGMVNLDLAMRLRQQHKGEDLSRHIVGNDVCFDTDGRILILTGPNRGGKTTWMGAVGLVHALGQAGLHVPAESAELSPVDAIHMHFPAEEDPTQESGRLGEEAQRLRHIFRHATSRSLVLLNESLASTSSAESYYLARDVLSCLRMLGARAVFVTHLHEVARDCDEINDGVPGESRLRSLVSEVVDDKASLRRTYRVRPAPPKGKSYAREIARQYGISLEQLRELLPAE